MYTLQEKIGAGGYSNVYKCVDHVGVRYVAKVLPMKGNKRYRVQKEVDILKRLLDTTRVARIIDACEDQENYYIIQEWCKGGDIKSYVGLYDVYGENTVASIVRGALRGLHHIHARGVIHRDIKAGNVLFADRTEDSEIKLVDFGAAVVTHQGKNALIECDEKELVCTPWFVAPEVLGHKACYGSDIWSVGVLAYLLLSGRLPFNDKENPFDPRITSVFRSIFMDEPRFTGSAWKHISDDAKDFIKICLEKDHEKRWQKAEEALGHKWLRSSDCQDRFTGDPLLKCKPFEYEDLTGMAARSLYVT